MNPVLVRRVVVVALTLEAVGFAVAAGYLTLDAVRHPPTSLGLPIGLVALTVLLAVVLAALGRAVAQRRLTARIPIVVWHVMLGLTAAQGMSAPGARLAAAPQLLVSLVAGLGVLVPGVLTESGHDATGDAGKSADDEAVSDDRRVGPA